MTVRRGVYADGDHGRKLLTFPDGEQLLAVAGAAALVGAGAVVSHQSAAYRIRSRSSGAEIQPYT
jgi:hypothetical protein